jgi:hypothetical protein
LNRPDPCAILRDDQEDPGPVAQWIEQRFPGFTQVPFDVVGKHAKEDVAAHTFFRPVVDGADLQINGLEGTKGPLGATEASIIQNGLL